MSENKYCQGSPEWLALRKGRISASKIPVIMGLSPYQTPRQLWEEELGFRPAQECKPHMQAGLDCEDVARKWAIKFNHRCPIKPKIVFAKENDKFMASLDGISDTNSFIVEIKRNNKEWHEYTKKGYIPECHKAQMQWQMYCADVKICQYISWGKKLDPESPPEKFDYIPDPALVLLLRDDEFIEKAKTAAYKFLRMLDDLEEPAMTDADYEDLSANVALQKRILEYQEYCDLEKHYAELSQSCKKYIILESGDRNAYGNGWKLTKSSRKGSVDYDKLCEDLSISDSQKEAFRKPSTMSYRITLKKD